MANNLPPVGARATVENMSLFERSMAAINKALKSSGDQAEKTAKQSNRAFSMIEAGVNSLMRRMPSLGNQFGDVAGSVEGFSKILGVSSSALMSYVAVLAVAAAGLAGFIALGMRGAALVGIAESFDRLTGSVGLLSQTLLTDLRRASAGTIRDFELMRLTNLALAGATGEFGQMFGEALPRLLEIARAQARATGQDVQYLFESLVTGIKRGTPLLIDNTGLTLKLSEANQEYAETLGITVEQMSAEQRQIAILNATLEAGGEAIAALGDAQETAATKIARAGTTISNVFDTLAVAIQPAFNAVLDTLNNVLFFVSNLVTAVAPYIAALAQMFANILGPANHALGKAIRTFNAPEVARAFFTGGARMIGALANGIMAAANRYVFPAVIAIAKFIADFLVGLSPPPKGPLSQIDKGGANVMKAWLDGFVGTALDPVEKVAAEVNALLGGVGTLNRAQVEKRLAQLDAALKPFSDRLEIVKANFDAIAKPAEAALNAIDRQLTTAVQALLKGEAGSAEAVRALDAQRASIEGALDAQQQLVDAAQIQYALAQAQQARERALLNIQMARLGVAEQTVSAVSGKSKSSSAKGAGDLKEPKLGGGAAPPPEVAGGGGTPLKGGDVLSALGLSEEAINAAGADMVAAFQGAIDKNVEGQFGANTGSLQAQLERIGSVNIGESITRRFDELGAGIMNSLRQTGIKIEKWFISLKMQIEDKVDSITNPSRAGSVPFFFNTLSANIQAGLDNTSASIVRWLESTAGSITAWVNNQLDPLYDGGIVNFFQGLPGRVSTLLQGWGDTIQTTLVDPFLEKLNTFFTVTIPALLQQGVDFFTELPGRISQALAPLANAFYVRIVLPLVRILNQAIDAFEQFANDALGTLMSVASVLNSGLGLAINLGAFSNAINLPHINPPAPPGAAKGGMFGPGLLRVGEHGEELLYNASRVGVLPNSITRAFDAISSVIPGMSLMGGAGVVNNSSSSTTNDNSMTNIFNGQQQPDDVVRKLSFMRAFG